MKISFGQLMHESVSSRHFVIIVVGASGVQLFGYIILGFFAFNTSGGSNGGEILTNTFMIGASAFLVGFVLGFIFGIPRASEASTELMQTLLANPEYLKTSQHIPFKYQANTNLEQVSDWLTKILIGIGLTQFNTFRQILGDFSTKMATTIPGLQYAEPIITSSIVFFSLIGLLEGYLLARVIMPAVFTQSEGNLHTIKANLRDLINLKLDFPPHETELLKSIIADIERGTGFTLPDDFKLKSKQHAALLSLEKRYLVNPKEGGNWGPGKEVELTPIARAIVQQLKEKLSA